MLESSGAATASDGSSPASNAPQASAAPNRPPGVGPRNWLPGRKYVRGSVDSLAARTTALVAAPETTRHQCAPPGTESVVGEASVSMNFTSAANSGDGAHSTRT